MRGLLRPLAMIVNEFVRAGFVLEQMVEQNVEDVGSASPEELACHPYVSRFDPDSREYRVTRKLPLTLIIKGRKGRLAEN